MRWLFWTHRWLGILTCLLCVMWLVSGLVMLHVPYPSFRDDERIARLAAIDTSRISVLPGEALAKAGIERAPTVFRLEMYGDEPVYRIVDFTRHVSISATDGREIKGVDAAEAQRRLARVVVQDTTYIGEIQSDLWTLGRRYDAHLPLHLFEIADGIGTRYYLSSRTGEIVQHTTRSERAWNWIGSVPHWIYVPALRSNGALWRQVVMWTAALAAIGSVLGLWIGVIRLRMRTRYAHGGVSPYRGLMRWHHLTGLVGGLSLTAWLVSGWLSVGPFGLFNSFPVTPDQLARYYTEGRPTFETSRETLVRILGEDSKEAQLNWVGGVPMIVTHDGKKAKPFLARNGDPAQLTEQQVANAAQRVFPERRIARTERLDQFDLYWYRHRSERPLPALRITFDDLAETWLTADLLTGRIVGASDTSERGHRWTFHFAHLYDHPFLLENPRLRETLIWSLSLIGIAISLTGAVIGLRSLRRCPPARRMIFQ